MAYPGDRPGTPPREPRVARYAALHDMLHTVLSVQPRCILVGSALSERGLTATNR